MQGLLSFIFIFFFTAAGAQTVLTGKVLDTKGNPVALANVSLAGTYDGASTDVDGTFQFMCVTPGSAELIVSFMGFKEFRQPITLTGNQLSFLVTLQEDFRSLDAVTISAGSYTASDASRRTIFRPLDIATTAGATADIAGALNTLPGTQKVGESGRLFVRGGEGRETRTFIDGLAVLDAYRASAPNTPSRGRFLPFMFKGVSFSTGGYSAEYGQALSSALVLDSKDRSDITRTDIGILSVGADVGHTQVWNTGSAGGKFQYTNIRPYVGLIKQETDWIAPPTSMDGSAAIRQQWGKNGIIKVFGNFNRTSFSLYNHSIDDFDNKERYDLANRYGYLNGSYKNILSRNWMLRGGVSYTHLQNAVRIAGEDLDVKENGIHTKTVLEGSLSEKTELKTGVEITDRTYSQGAEGLEFSSFREFIAAGFAEADVYITKNFVTRSGFRVEHDALNNTTSFDPRLSVAYKCGSSGQFSAAYGKFRQSAENEWIRMNKDLGAERADHYILNYQRIENNRTFRIETFYKVYHQLVRFRNAGALPDNTGYGFAKGIELFWRDEQSFENVDYWLSYSFLDTKREYLNFPFEVTPAFASAHNFSAVYKHFFPHLKTQLGLTYSFASGRPYNDPNENKFNGRRTPSYHDLSVNVSYLPKPYLIFYFSCTNLLGRDNLFGYEYSQQLNENGLYNGRAIRQAARNFVFVGIFITLSKERSVNQLPNL